MTRTRSPGRRAGFTLMEVMIAIAITAFIGTSIAMAFNTTMASKEVVENEVERYRMLRGTFARMTREIGAAYVSDRYDVKRYRDQYDRPTNFIGTREKLIFSSLAHQRLFADATESDQRVVEYSVKSSTEKNANGRSDLVRRENPILEERMDRGGAEETLFEGIKKLEFEYWDPDKKKWDDEWDTRRMERRSILPTRVRMTIHALDENGKEVKYSTQTRIALNTEFPRYQ